MRLFAACGVLLGACAALPLPPLADLHVDLPYQVQYRGRSPDLRQGGSDVTTASLRTGNVRLLVLSLHVPRGLRPRLIPVSELYSVLETAERVAATNGFVVGQRAAPSRTTLTAASTTASRARSPTDRADDPPRVLFGIEEGQPLAHAQDHVEALVARGVRLFGLVHAHHNDLCDSATDPFPERGGLTPLGAKLVRRIYAAGGLVDLAHASLATFWAVAAIARELHKPLVVSHTAARALADHPRNLSDEQLREVARSGGVAGLLFHSPHLRPRGPGAAPELASLRDVVRHLGHFVRVLGPAHAAIGSDIDGLIRAARGLQTHAGVPALAAALRGAGMSEAVLRAVWFDNVARVLRPASSAAAR